jgi:hypothetical protein
MALQTAAVSEYAKRGFFGWIFLQYIPYAGQSTTVLVQDDTRTALQDIQYNIMARTIIRTN